MAKEQEIIVDDVIEGLSACISVNIREPQFSSQNKEMISGPDEEKAIYDALVREFRKFIKNSDQETINTIKTRIKNNSKARRAAEVAKITKKKSLSKNSSPANLPSKLKECEFPGDDLAELYLCLTGDTKVKMLDGTSEEIANLVGKTNIPIIGYDGDEKIITNMKRAFKTQEVKRTLRITMEDNSIIECTPEHKFLVDGSWVMAKDLKVGTDIQTV